MIFEKNLSVILSIPCFVQIPSTKGNTCLERLSRAPLLPSASLRLPMRLVQMLFPTVPPVRAMTRFDSNWAPML